MLPCWDSACVLAVSPQVRSVDWATGQVVYRSVYLFGWVLVAALPAVCLLGPFHTSDGEGSPIVCHLGSCSA